MTRHRRTTMCAWLCLLPAASAAQLPSSFDSKRLVPFNVSGTVYAVRDTDTLSIGSYAEELTVDSGRFVYSRIVLTGIRSFSKLVDTIILEPAALRVVAYYERNPVGVGRVELTNARVQGSMTTPDGATTPIAFAYDSLARPEPSLSLLLAAMDLKDGVAFSVPLFNPLAENSTLAIKASVTGADSLHGRLCWKVVASFISTFQLAFWIDPVTHTTCRATMPLSLENPHLQLLFDARPPRHLPGAQ